MPTDLTGSTADDERLNFALRVGGSDPARVIFFLSGHLAGAACSGFEDFTRRCIDGGTRRLRLDLAELESIDLDGVNVLLTAQRLLAEHAGRLFITNASSEIGSTLRLFARPLLATETSVIFGPAGNGARDRMRPRRRLAG